MTNFKEQRKHERFSIKTNVFITGDGFLRFKTQTMDLSDGGLFVEGKVLSELQIGKKIQVKIAEGPEDSPLLNARIAWTNSYGAGIEYL